MLALKKVSIVNRIDRISARVGLMHIGVFILLLLSGERNFGVRLNKPYTVRVPMDIPVFTGTHADFLIIVSTECFLLLRYKKMFYNMKSLCDLNKYPYFPEINVYLRLHGWHIRFSAIWFVRYSTKLSQLVTKDYNRYSTAFSPL